MLDRGSTTKDILASGHSKATLSRVREGREKERKQAERKAADDRRQQASKSPAAAEQKDATRPRSLEPIVVGGLIIEPADWRINQYGGFLIMSTYELARQRYGYEGTVGEFLCDAIQILRKIMGMDIMPFQYLQEGDNGTNGQEASQGGGVSAESGEDPDREPKPAEVP